MRLPHLVLPSTEHSVRTSAPPVAVWELLGTPTRWPSYDPLLRSIEGADGPAKRGQHLMAVARLFPLRIPVDVRDFKAGSRLGLTVHLLPGLREEIDATLVASVDGGTEIVARYRTEGVFGQAAAVPVWVGAEVVLRLLGWRSARRYRASLAGKRSQGVA